jgi:copper chaperone
MFDGLGSETLQQKAKKSRIVLIPPGGMRIIFWEHDVMRNTLKLSIEGMHCGGCIRRVTAALEAIKGVELNSVEVGSAQLNFHPEQTNAEEIAAAVNLIGFSARVEE